LFELQQSNKSKHRHSDSDSSVVVKGQFAPDDPDVEQQVRRLVEEECDRLSLQTIRKQREVTTVCWDILNRFGACQSSKHVPPFMGKWVNGCRRLSGYETLFLLEAGNVFVTLTQDANQVPITVQELYGQVITSRRILNRYLVYVHLLRLGYRVRQWASKADVSAAKKAKKADPCEAVESEACPLPASSECLMHLNVTEQTRLKRLLDEQVDDRARLDGADQDFMLKMREQRKASHRFEDDTIEHDQREQEPCMQFGDSVLVSDLTIDGCSGKSVESKEAEWFKRLKEQQLACVRRFDQVMTEAELNRRLSAHGPIEGINGQQSNDDCDVDFEVYSPKTDGKLNGKPADFLVKVLDDQDDELDLDLVLRLNEQIADSYERLIWAFVVRGEVNWHRFASVQLSRID
jgi:hypothetical protein